jgi:tRNA(Ile2)-agmatinylcytidine synthase
VTVIGIDDTDSRERGMCTTYVAARVAERVRDVGGAVSRTLLVRLNPAVEHKTRGNAALAVHCDLPADDALAVADDALDRAETGDPRTNPGAVISPGRPDAVPADVADLSRRAVREYVTLDETRKIIEAAGLRTAERKTGRGLVGATAAVGAFCAFEEWTYERLSYREPGRWGTERDVETGSVFAAADEGYPDVWDTVDHGEGVAVCVPHTPCPILHGVRGESAAAVEAVARRIDGEQVAFGHTFRTNQGTDVHIREGRPGALQDGRSYRVTGTVCSAPETEQGGHVFTTIGAEGKRVQCAAFEPTKRFRDRVRSLRVGDRVTVCGEVSDGTLKLEKFAVRELVTTERVNPTCPACGRSMASAGADAGYRCRDCGTHADDKSTREIEREIEEGWYEVPPVARRHIAKPLVRGGFDAPTHPER